MYLLSIIDIQQILDASLVNWAPHRATTGCRQAINRHFGPRLSCCVPAQLIAPFYPSTPLLLRPCTVWHSVCGSRFGAPNRPINPVIYLEAPFNIFILSLSHSYTHTEHTHTHKHQFFILFLFRIFFVSPALVARQVKQPRTALPAAGVAANVDAVGGFLH